jgi:hypothetical protein
VCLRNYGPNAVGTQPPRIARQHDSLVANVRLPG